MLQGRQGKSHSNAPVCLWSRWMPRDARTGLERSLRSQTAMFTALASRILRASTSCREHSSWCRLQCLVPWLLIEMLGFIGGVPVSHLRVRPAGVSAGPAAVVLSTVTAAAAARREGACCCGAAAIEAAAAACSCESTPFASTSSVRDERPGGAFAASGG